ncbi:Na+/H+ antiporter NhaA [Geotalea toluenoxydans]|uniref:Na+/H+ antiporter NhaA n=1 Tax=Geotalea toluenoxydans TaxID=421624 RepID=UPI0006D14365|nr:Na+/H+ antiporter NhaA [Geotalea toluenoxydans]
MKKRLNMLREFSVPLLAGVVTALFWINLDPHGYHSFVHSPSIAGLSFHFITNDLFMVLFFAIAAVEITQSFHPGGDLNPLKKALNPLFATVGGVTGPIIVYFCINFLIGTPALRHGWGIPTATDIAFAWLAARLVFGKNHPVVSFLLLLAVADDAIGLAIIAIFYPDPHLSAAPQWLLLTAGGVFAALALRWAKIRNYWPYIIIGGGLSWAGLFNAHLHPALALVFIIPLLPHAARERKHIFEEDPDDLSTLARFEHDWKVFVDLGLFMFGLANAGVEFTAVGPATWIVLFSLIVGKTLGVFAFGTIAELFGYQLPKGMGRRELFLAGVIAGIGFTVALFVAGEAFVEPGAQGAAKMGAMLSILAAPLALLLSKLSKPSR